MEKMTSKEKNESKPGQEGGECSRQGRSDAKSATLKSLDFTVMAMMGDGNTEEEASNILFAFSRLQYGD